MEWAERTVTKRWCVIEGAVMGAVERCGVGPDGGRRQLTRGGADAFGAVAAGITALCEVSCAACRASPVLAPRVDTCDCSFSALPAPIRLLALSDNVSAASAAHNAQVPLVTSKVLSASRSMAIAASASASVKPWKGHVVTR